MDLQPLNKFLPAGNSLISYREVLPEVFDYAGINNEKRAAMFFANVSHETGGFRVFEESLWYTATRLATVWPSRFRGKDGKPNELAYEVEKNQQKTANVVYANRMGNGDQASGQGYLYRGRGLPMLTGLDNYRMFDSEMNMNGKIVTNPNMVALPYWSAFAAGVFFKNKGIGPLADQGKIKEARKRWNGGTIGLSDVVTNYNKFLTVMDQVL